MHIARGIAVGTAVVIVAATHASTVAPRPCAVELGLSPEAIVIAGGTADDVASIVTALEAATSLRAVLAQRRADADAIVAALSAFNERAQREVMTEAEEAEGEQLRASLAAARDAILSAEAILRAAVLSGHSGVNDAVVQTQVHNGHRMVPPEFRVLDLSPAEWQAIERALRRERSDAGAALSESEQQLLTAVRADEAVGAAKQRLDLHLAAARVAFAEYAR